MTFVTLVVVHDKTSPLPIYSPDYKYAVAGKITRDVKMWWTKLEKVITYRQKVVYDKSRQQAMNRQLVTLVKQTERYTESLAHTTTNNSMSVSDESEGDTTTDGSHRRHRRGRRQQRPSLTIEEALAQTTRTRKVNDYARLAKLQEASASEDDHSVNMYGVTFDSTSDNASDSSYAPESDESDDETTLREAEAAEQRERVGKETESSFVADPIELLKLQEEQEMDIDAVLKRLHDETKDSDVPVEDEPMDASDFEDKIKDKVRSEQATSKYVQFAPKVDVRPTEPNDPGADADDDGDASDVEDFVGEDMDQDDEFQPDVATVDDETTMEQEEALPQEMTADEELELLNAEMDIPVDELRKRYAAALAATTDSTLDDVVDEEVDEDTDNDHGDEAFEPEKGADVDDETTIEAEEKLGRDMSYEDEIALLQREGEMSVEELRALYGGIQDTVDDDDEDVASMDVDEPDEPITEQKSSASELVDQFEDEDEDQEEFQPEKGADVDDETTIEAEERLGRDMSYEDELALLKQEGEMSVEELRKMYTNMDERPVGKNTEEEDRNSLPPGALVSRPDGTDESSLMRRKALRREVEGAENREAEESVETSSSERPGKRQRTNSIDATVSDTDAALAALEESAERARMTLASRPFLLSRWVKLRAYQQIGLNWLVSLHSRRLNGILADEVSFF